MCEEYVDTCIKMFMASCYRFYFEPNANIVSRREDYVEDCLKLRMKKVHEHELDRCVSLLSIAIT
jgi:hypothetical protein